MQTILGGGGAISIPLTKALASYTDAIRIVSRSPQKVNEQDQLLAADLAQKEELFKAVEGSDIAYLTLGLDTYSASAWQKLWPPLMRNTIEACKKFGVRLVFFDNIYMYDPRYMSNITEKTPVKPASKKGQVRAKIAAMLADEFKKDTLQAAIARSADFYGPDSTNSILKQTVVDNLRKGKAATWLADAHKIHNLTFTLDAAKAMALLGNTPEAYNQVWHLPTDHRKITGQEWIDLVATELGVEPKNRTLPVWLMGLLGLFMPIMKELKEMSYQYRNDYFFNSTKFEEAFDFKPTTPAEGVKKILKKR